MVIQPNGRGDLMVVNLVDGGPAKTSGQVASLFLWYSLSWDHSVNSCCSTSIDLHMKHTCSVNGLDDSIKLFQITRLHSL